MKFRRLTEAVVEDAALPTGYLRKTDSNANVKMLQKLLIKLEYLSGTADGVFGPKTEKALKSFQKDNNITVDGIYGSQSREALKAQVSL